MPTAKHILDYVNSIYRNTMKKCKYLKMSVFSLLLVSIIAYTGTRLDSWYADNKRGVVYAMLFVVPKTL